MTDAERERRDGRWRIAAAAVGGLVGGVARAVTQWLLHRAGD